MPAWCAQGNPRNRKFLGQYGRGYSRGGDCRHRHRPAGDILCLVRRSATARFAIFFRNTPRTAGTYSRSIRTGVIYRRKFGSSLTSWPTGSVPRRPGTPSPTPSPASNCNVANLPCGRRDFHRAAFGGDPRAGIRIAGYESGYRVDSDAGQCAGKRRSRDRPAPRSRLPSFDRISRQRTVGQRRKR